MSKLFFVEIISPCLYLFPYSKHLSIRYREAHDPWSCLHVQALCDLPEHGVKIYPIPALNYLRQQVTFILFTTYIHPAHCKGHNRLFINTLKWFGLNIS